MFVVLYSEVHDCWKLADFGSASTATSKRLHTTHLARGTGGYRAPEVLEHWKCNTKADMFALGCTIYEIVIGKKLFAGDTDVTDYGRNKDLFFFTEKWPEPPPDTQLHALGKLTEALIDVNPAKRPGSVAVQRWIDLIRRGAYRQIAEEATLSHWPTDEMPQVQSTRPQVQSLFLQAKKRKRDSSLPDLESPELHCPPLSVHGEVAQSPVHQPWPTSQSERSPFPFTVVAIHGISHTMHHPIHSNHPMQC